MDRLVGEIENKQLLKIFYNGNDSAKGREIELTPRGKKLIYCGREG